MHEDVQDIASGETLAAESGRTPDRQPAESEAALETLGPTSGEPAEPATPRGDDPTQAGHDRQLASASAPTKTPDRIGRYIVIAPIGEGGMGLVFSAYDAELDRKIAVKLVRPALRGSEDGSPGDPHRRLLREAQVLAKLSHPNIIHVYEVGALRDEIFIAMEYFEGPTLERWQDREDVSWREVLAMYREAGRGLEAAHAAGLVHRDFKPSNVLVGADGQVRVIDFGLAREAAAGSLAPNPGELADGSVARLTMTGAIMGTPAYMAPEQHAGQTVDARTDQFSFCVSLYEALYGERPFAGTTLAELTANVMAGTIQPPPPHFERVPAWLRRALLRGLAVNPDDRYPSITQLLDALGHDPAIRRRRVLVGVAAIAVALLGVLAWDRVSELRGAQQEGERLRLEFGRSRASNAEDELLHLRTRTAAQRFDDLVLAWASEQLEHDPTRALASLRHLHDIEGKLGAARTIAADAWQRGVARASTGLSGQVRALAVAPSGSFVATLATNDVVHTWNASTGERLSWPCPEPVRALAVASTSASFAVGTEQGTIHLVDPHEGRVDTIAAHEGPIHALSFSADDAILASAGADRAVRRWTVATGERIDAMTNHEAAVVALVHELDGPALISADATGELAWWDPRAGKVQRVDAHAGPVRSLSAAGNQVWSVAADGKLLRWQVGGRPLPTALEQVADVRATQNGSVIAVHLDGSVSLRDSEPDAPTRTLSVSGPATHVAHSPGDDSIWLAGPSIGVQRWDATPDRAHVLPIGQIARALAFSPDGSLLAIAGSHATLRIEGVGREHTAELELEGQPVRMRFSAAGDRLAIQFLDGAVRIYDAPGPGPGPGRRVVEGSPDKQLLGSLDGAPHPELTWTNDDRALLLAACYEPDRCSVLSVDPSTGELLASSQARFISNLEPDATGAFVLLGRREHTVAVVELATDEYFITTFEDELVLGQAWSNGGDGRVRIATTSDGTLRVWSWQPASEQRHRILEESGFSELRPSEDATSLYLRAGDKQAVLWSIAGARFSPVPELPAGVTSIVLTDDGLHLLARGQSDDDGAAFGFLLDVEIRQGRRLPALFDPVALSVEGVVADYRWGGGVRVWDEPTPADAEGFRAWLEQATTIAVPLDDLRTGPGDP